MHIYAFGSVCRGDIDSSSDIDLLAIVNGFDHRFDPQLYSIYSRRRIGEIWAEGNPFAWHLSIESRLIFSSDGSDILSSMGQPNRYTACRQDCEKFRNLFLEAQSSIREDGRTMTFDLSTTFLAIRNFATCFSLGRLETPVFSRNAALLLSERSLPISAAAYSVFERARILCTRGYGPGVSKDEAHMAMGFLSTIEKWMNGLLLEICRDDI